jgi:hypothetical protein
MTVRTQWRKRGERAFLTRRHSMCKGNVAGTWEVGSRLTIQELVDHFREPCITGKAEKSLKDNGRPGLIKSSF